MNILSRFASVLLLFTFEVAADNGSNFDILASIDAGPGNVTVMDNGRIIMSLHQFYLPKYTVVEYKNKALVPFPNEEWSAADSKSTLKLDSVLGIRSDVNGMRSGAMPKLVGWNTKTDKLHQVVYLPEPVAPKDAFVNDFAVDSRRHHIFISDPAGGTNAALIVVNLTTGKARRVLEGHTSVIPEAVDLIIDKVPVQVKDESERLVRPHIGVNPITEDLNNEWVYFGPMHGHSLYRIKADDLVDENLNTGVLANRVQRYSSKPVSDGMTIYKDNNIYLGELAANAIGVISSNRTYHRLAQSHTLNGGVSTSKPPYYLIRVKALAAGLPGR